MTLLCSDVATLLLAVAARTIIFGAVPSSSDVAQLIVAVTVGLALFGCYGPGDQRRNPGSLARAAAIGSGVALWSSVWSSPSTAWITLGSTWLITTIFLLSARRLVNWAVRMVRPAHANVARAVVIGSAEQAVELVDHPAIGETPWCHLAAFLDPAEAAIDDTCTALARLIRTHHVDTVIIVGRLDTHHFSMVIDAAITSGCQVLSFPRVPPTRKVSPRLVWRDGSAIMEFTRPGVFGAELMVKRTIDVLVASTALIALTPLLAIVALLSWLRNDGPVLFWQNRIGQGGRPFRIVKFRTMALGAEQMRSALETQSAYGDARLFKITDDPRITPLGKILRRTSIDELPQLWNVLVGDMSLVGPRPPLPDEVAEYEAKDYARFDVKPGLTGPWQVNGRNRMCDFEEVVRLETAYIRRWSIWLDLELLLRTVPVVLSRRGAH